MEVPWGKRHKDLDKNEWPSTQTRPCGYTYQQKGKIPNQLAVCPVIQSSECQFSSGKNRSRQSSPSFIESNRKIANSVEFNQIQRTLCITDSRGDENQVIEAIELQGKLMEKVLRRKSKSAKITMVHYMTALLSIMMLLLPILLADPLDGTALFDKNQQMDKLISKNQIAYHFKKNVREVTQELFISRQLDVSALFLGVQALRQTSQELTKYCDTLGGHSNPKSPLMPNAYYGKSPYVHIGIPQYASYAEAKARCKAIHMQLPEVYSEAQREQMSSFLRLNKLNNAFAGLEPDIPDAIYRFASTGYPIWKTPHKQAIMHNDVPVNIEAILDDLNQKFMYSKNGELRVYSVNSISSNPYFNLGANNYRDAVKDFSQIVGAIVCEPEWNGLTYNFPIDKGLVGETQVYSHPRRSVDDEPLKKGNSDSNDNSVDKDTSNKGYPNSTDWMYSDGPSNKGDSDQSIPETMKEYCISIATQASDISDDMGVKLKNLLSLVDITVLLDNDSRLQKKERDLSDTMLEPYDPNQVAANRKKRFAFLAKFIFTTGIRLIWGLIGFVDKIKTKRRLVKIESKLSAVQKQSITNLDQVHKMSALVAGNSIAIGGLIITTADLTRRMNNLEAKVNSIVYTVSDLSDNFKDMMKLSLVANLINRIQQSLAGGYDVLKDIIHCSLLEQTSPLLLPLDQIVLVQNEVRKVSTGILDTDFVKMQSIVVSDPSDPHLLLVVINVAALSRTELELVNLVSIPQFEEDKSFSPTLDYHAIVVDQLARKYFVLTEQEENDCMFGRCYISDVERSIDQKTCGIPQLFDQQLDACVYEEHLPDTGVFIKPMLPDGIIFAFRSEVSTQLFCQDNTKIGSPRPLSGTGIMQLPNGCILSVTDKLGKNSKVRGQPIYRAITAEDISLVMNGPLKELQTLAGKKETQRKLTADGILVDHLFPVVQQVNSVDAKVDHQSFFIWGLIAALSLAVIIIAVVIFYIIKARIQFFKKIYDLRHRFTDIGEQILDLKKLRDRLNRRPDTPATHHRIREAFHHLGSQRRLFGHAFDTHPDDNDPEDPTYVSMDNLGSLGRPTAPPRAMAAPVNLSGNRTLLSFQLPRKAKEPVAGAYPNLSQPLLDQLELEKECGEVEELCHAVRIKKKDENNYSK